MTEQPILVLGATGTTGRRVAARLAARGHVVRGASRHGVVRFDWSDAGTWRPALAGVRSVYLMAPHELPVEPAFVREAVGQGVRRLVLLSSRAVEEMGDERLLAAESTVRESGVEWTVVRADWFNQNFDEGFFRPAIEAGELAVPVGDTRQGFVDADDIAAVAVAALTEAGHEGKTYEVTGPRGLTFGEALDIIGEASGRRLTFRGSADEYRAQQAALGMPEEQTEQEVIAYRQLTGLGHPGGARQKVEPTTDTVATVTGRPPIDFADYAARVWTGVR
ncbi:NAD(P)H-binding protein [Actinosynnema sp. CS-041913]|uniref:NAD(P)H-binding protein n=1 Tax=Actinosynnema sp. CS-041913 TaxID=3239917 RepID=UPI003D8F9FC0